ncbi:SMI1/KNR4 family protein [Planococcus sp. YIM B11945]|uniref:SMI1/KNR4 family protein n=1 Tax=Planococcus sp. YIM B11945 TaxID=3435410 RepID=UPI003D7D7A60
MMRVVLEQISKQLGSHFGSFLNEPASVEEIGKVEQEIGVDFTEELKELYRIHNGELSEGPGLFFGMAFLSLTAMLNEWRFSSETADAELAHEIPSYSVPAEVIKERYSNKKWLPIAHDYGGNFLAVDLDPGPKGVYGQIINYGRDEEVKYVVAYSVKDLLEFISKTIESGFYTIDEEMWSYSHVEDRHFLDALREMPLPVLNAVALVSKAEMALSPEALDAEWKERIEKMSGNFKRFSREKLIFLGAKGIKDISPLAACTDVRELILSKNEVRNLAPLQTVTTLKRLYLGSNPIASLSPLRNLENLQYLNISNTPVTDAAPLISLGKLKELYMANTHIEDYHFLKQLPELQTLSISIFSYGQLAALVEATQLKHLQIDQLAGVTQGDIIMLSRLKNLQSVTIKGAALRNLQFLLGNQKLKELILIDCAIADGSAINRLPIEILECSQTPIRNIEVIAGSPTLQAFAGSFQQFWTLKQLVSRPVDFSKIIGGMTDKEEEIWMSSLKEK